MPKYPKPCSNKMNPESQSDKISGCMSATKRTKESGEAIKPQFWETSHPKNQSVIL